MKVLPINTIFVMSGKGKTIVKFRFHEVREG